ncbi:MAG TPA: hypothetical protein VGS22_25435 [Thermoanaerobaculia bacterium]|jgi:hypothetical protein|nr:hypothetical protein [Thermoanaerobaculia bacterium]
METENGSPGAPVPGPIVPAGAAIEIPGPPVPTGPTCADHPRQAAVTRCSSCGKQLCTLCIFPLGEWNFCGDCALRQAGSQAARPVNTAVSPTAQPNVPAPRAQCAYHPDSPAVVSCKLCSRWICATCDFALPGDVHLCPSCIETQSTVDVNPKRKKWSYIALALAAWSTFLSLLLFVGVFNSLLNSEGGEAFDRVITTLIFWPCVIGTGLAMGALDKKLKNTGLMKAALWWNAAIGGVFLLLILASNLGLTGK